MLKVENLCVSYGAINAVRNSSFEVNEGEIVAIIGNNGAGKSSTLRALSGIVTPKSGKIRLFGEEIAGCKGYKVSRKGMAMVPEGRGIYTRMSVMENLEMGAFTRKDKEKVKKDFEKVFDLFPILGERRRQKGGSLSGGEQQMLAVGRAIMQNPKILLLDEPSLGLAPQVIASIFDVLKELNRTEHLPILLVEQNVFLALELSDKGYVMETGEIVLHDTSKKLLENETVKKAYLGEE